MNALVTNLREQETEFEGRHVDHYSLDRSTGRGCRRIHRPDMVIVGDLAGMERVFREVVLYWDVEGSTSRKHDCTVHEVRTVAAVCVITEFTSVHPCSVLWSDSRAPALVRSMYCTVPPQW